MPTICRFRWSSILGALVFVSGVMASGTFVFAPSAWAIPASPQQPGAVPLTQGIGDLASQLSKSIPEGHSMTIAVTDFPQKKQVCGLGQFVAERLSTLMSRQPQCRLIAAAPAGPGAARTEIQHVGTC